MELLVDRIDAARSSGRNRLVARAAPSVEGPMPVIRESYHAFREAFDLEAVGLDDDLDSRARDRAAGRDVHL